MTGRTAIFGSVPDEVQDSQKLKDLYWNRAELKKDFARLRAENYRLQDRIKEQEGERARIEQKLKHVEDLLFDPDWMHSVVVSYQLRGLYDRCRRKLERFAEELKQQRERRAHGKLVKVWQQEQAGKIAAIEREAREIRDQIRALEDQQRTETERLQSSGGITRLFRRRSVRSTIAGIDDRLAELGPQHSALHQELERIRNAAPPDQQGLDIPTKRSINFMIIAFAQQLYLHFSDDQLAGMAKEANDKSTGAVQYGSKADCDGLLRKIRERGNSFDDVGDIADLLKQRARLIAEGALYQNDDDAAPVPATVATVFDIDGNGVIRRSDANLVGENYWNLSAVLAL